MSRTRRTLTLALLMVVAPALSGCLQSTGGGDGSRQTLYSSTDELAADSALVIVGTAGERTTIDPKSGTAETGTTVVVNDVLGGAARDASQLGAEVVVWQLGDDRIIGPAPLIQKGTTYLLFLTATGLPERGDNAYFVTGGTAGLWLPTDSSGTFKRSGDEGDTLPDVLSAEDVRALSK